MTTEAPFDHAHIKFEDLHDQLSAKARPEFGYVTDPSVTTGVVTVQDGGAVIHPQDASRLRNVVVSAGWTPIDQT